MAAERCTFAYQVGPVAFHGFSSPTLPLDHEEAEGKSSGFHLQWFLKGQEEKQYTLQAGTSSQDQKGIGGPLKPSGIWRGDLTFTMKLWLFACLVACFVGAWMLVVHAQGAFEDCCLGYQHRIKWNVLRHARNYHQQEVSGSCNLRAVRFYFRQKVVCGNPEDMNVKRAMRILTARKRLVHWKSASDSQTERKKSNQMKSKVENPNSTSVRSATLGHPRMVMMPRKTNN
uniref:C-C motif chemokine 25 n=1 Tax=Mus spicilegus TaxID=10103 RepID=A0A8C6II17_MUSSI